MKNVMPTHSLFLLAALLCSAVLPSTSLAVIDEAKAAKQIDSLVNIDLKQRKLNPHPLVDDHTFLRRATLTMAGRIPLYSEIKSFEAKDKASRRHQTVDALSQSSDFPLHMYNFFADMLRLRTHVNGQTDLQPYRDWIEDAIVNDMPYDKMVHRMLTAEGNQYEDPAVGYYLRDPGMPRDNLAMTMQTFLGTRLQCSQCHNHPTEKWTQAEFFKLASLSNSSTRIGHHQEPLLKSWKEKQKAGKIKMSRAINNPLREQIFDPLTNRVNFREQDVALPHDYAYDDYKPKAKVPPSVPLGPKLEVKEDTPRIKQFAAWLTSRDNTHFNEVMANRLWQWTMGRALFEPVDDLTPSTVITNKPLLTYLGTLYRDLNYNTKAFVRVLVKTDLFRRQVVNQDPGVDKPFPFQGPLLRRMSAEQIWDSFVYLLRGKPGIHHPHLYGLRAKHVTGKAQFEYLQSLGPERFSHMMETLAKQTEHLDPKIKALREKEREATGKDRNKIRKEIRALEDEGRQIMAGIFGKGNDGSGTKMEMAANDGGSGTKGDPKALMPQDRSKLDKKWDRYLMASSKMVSPVNAGHELLVFGASERHLTNSSSREATVPQALIMLNGDNGPSLFWEETVLKKDLAKIESNDEAIDCIFLSLLGRYPSDKDRSLAQAAIKEVGRWEGIRRVALAITQTKRFIFIN